MRGRAAVLLLLGLFCCASAERLVKSALPLNVTDNLSEHLSCPVMTAAHSTGAPCPAAGHGTAHGSKPSDGGVAATLSPKDVGPSPLTQAVIISPPVNASTAQQHASAAQLTAQASWLPKLLMKAGIALLVALALHVLVSMRSRCACKPCVMLSTSYFKQTPVRLSVLSKFLHLCLESDGRYCACAVICMACRSTPFPKQGITYWLQRGMQQCSAFFVNRTG